MNNNLNIMRMNEADEFLVLVFERLDCVLVSCCPAE